ncbi:MAG: sigma-70 family RNA polymerase sigma factor [Myxococcales bacterium]|nr:sigma-70 family RNA polymerase sigma factor [Myxococcales bacterium]MCB9651200.1 sigma-70 family RNA polymerase sigma factor [Deltaproteobacteria bacterium]
MDGAPTRGDITAALDAWRQGQPGALEDLIPLVFHELRALARRQLARERPDHTLAPTAVVHEVYLRLMRQPPPPIQDRQHFFALTARLMRRILIEHGRARSAAKRGRGQRAELREDDHLEADSVDLDLALSVQRAVDALAERDPDLAQLVTLRYLVGLSVPEVALALELSTATVERRWALARRRLREALASINEPSHSRPAANTPREPRARVPRS